MKIDFPNIIDLDEVGIQQIKLNKFLNECHQNFSRIDARKLFTAYINKKLSSEQQLKNKALIKKIPVNILTDTTCYLSYLLDNNQYVPNVYLQRFENQIPIILNFYKKLMQDVALKETIISQTLPVSVISDIDNILGFLSLNKKEKFIFTKEWFKEYNLKKRELKSLKYVLEERLKRYGNHYSSNVLTSIESILGCLI